MNIPEPDDEDDYLPFASMTPEEKAKFEQLMNEFRAELHPEMIQK
jgi:hypothetical protein